MYIYIKLSFFLPNKMSPRGSDGKESACNAGDLGSIPGLGRSPGEGNGNPLQYSCMGNAMDKGALWAVVHGFAKSQTWLRHTHTNKTLTCSCLFYFFFFIYFFF